jgi:hypothetical protein
MKAILENTWFISIITGIMVFLFTKLIESAIYRKRYWNKVELANIEISNILKQLVPNSNLPEIPVVQSIHTAAARKYHVKQDDIDSLEIIFDGLVKDIMETSFLNYEDKLLYSNSLTDLKTRIHGEKLISSEIKENQSLSIFAPVTAIFATTLSIFINFIFSESTYQITQKLTFAAIIITIVLSVITIINTIIFDIPKEKTKDDENKVSDNSIKI